MRLATVRARTNAFTVTPAQYARAAYVALGALALIVLTGAAVRLTGSGLGCPDWPKCYGKDIPPLETHAVIEYSNRLITALVTIAALSAAVLAWRRRPFRRDLALLGTLLPVGVLAQAVLGGFTVRGKLDYGFVMGHFALSMLLLLAGAALVWRVRHAPGERPRSGDRATVWVVRALVPLGALTIFAGTAATAAGPHAGGSPGQEINRLDIEGRGTLSWAIHQHGAIAALLGVAAVAAWLWVRRRDADPLVGRSLTAVVALLAAQGLVGGVQYQLHLPSEIVWVHVGLASATWLAILWSAAAAGRLVPRAAAAPVAAEVRAGY
jgi:cytochrome c oxidase assembly protein subunit 15